MYVCTLVMMMMKTEWITIYRILTEALELMGFENATDLNKQYEDKGSGLEFVLQQEVLLKGLMHFVQDTTHVDISVIIWFTIPVKWSGLQPW